MPRPPYILSSRATPEGLLQIGLSGVEGFLEEVISGLWLSATSLHHLPFPDGASRGSL